MQYKYSKIIIGIDESYKRTGVSIVGNDKLILINSIDFSKYKNNSEKRKRLRKSLYKLFAKVKNLSDDIIVIIERIRLRSEGFLNIDYIKSIGALNSVIIDCCYEFGYPIFSVDTRSWKSKIVGTTKSKNNKLFVDPKKFPTIQFLIKHGYEEKIKAYLPDNTKKKNFLIDENGRKFLYNDDAADSACIALYGTLSDAILKEER